MRKFRIVKRPAKTWTYLVEVKGIFFWGYLDSFSTLEEAEKLIKNEIAQDALEELSDTVVGYYDSKTMDASTLNNLHEGGAT